MLMVEETRKKKGMERCAVRPILETACYTVLVQLAHTIM